MADPVWVFDVEGTLTGGETWKGVGRWLVEKGHERAYKRFFNSHLPGALLAKTGLINKRNYQNKWMRDLAGLFRGFACELVDEVGRWVTTEELWPGRREDVLDELRAGLESGARVVLASGSYEPVLKAFAAAIDPRVEVLGTPLVCRHGRASGELAGPINVGQEKVRRVLEYLAAKPERAYGDTYPDRYLLELAAEPVAVYPDPRLRRLARKNNWRVFERELA